MIYAISENADEQSLDARIELDGTAVLLHSRGGSTGGRPARNTEYEKALPLILERLRANQPAGIPHIQRVLLDSKVARRYTLQEREVLSGNEISQLSVEALASLARQRGKSLFQKPGAKGGNATKALRIETANLSKADLHRILRLREWPHDEPSKSATGRLSNAEQRLVSPEHINRAVSRLLSGEDASNFSQSRDFDVLLDDGTRLAPKKVFGLALEEALGIEALPSHFSAGWSQPCFELIQAAGYPIVRKNSDLPPKEEIEAALASLSPDESDRAAIEGSLKLVKHFQRERSSGLSKRKKAAFVLEHGRLYCERCGMDPVAVYGVAAGHACIEVHHAFVQVKDMEEAHETELGHLQCLCANCHRVVHREMALASGT